MRSRSCPEHNPDGYCGLAGTGVSCPVGVLKGRGQSLYASVTDATYRDT
jgi:hypothetical protein